MKTIFDVNKIPTTGQIRNILDECDQKSFNKVYYDALNWLKKAIILENLIF
jgi:hypothetical protein